MYEKYSLLELNTTITVRDERRNEMPATFHAHCRAWNTNKNQVTTTMTQNFS